MRSRISSRAGRSRAGRSGHALAAAAFALVGAVGAVGATGTRSFAADTPAGPPAPAADSSAAERAAPRDTVVLGREAPADSTRAARRAAADSTRHEASPFSVMLRSAVLPGWGQVYNGKLPKAAIVVGGEGLLIYKAVEEWNKEKDAAAAGDAEGANRHMNLKVNYIWWAAVVHLLQMADAYVDAQLSHFEADFEPDEAALPGERPEPRLRLAFRAAF